jgi:diguanylate cyclase (GGDEF)-like protein
MPSPLRILHVEDNPADAELLVRAFREAGRDATWTRVDSEEAYLAALDTAPDIVVSDYSLPRFSGARALELLRTRSRELPFILVSGTIGEEKAAQIMRLGATDYLLKDRLARLPAAVEKAVAEARERVASRRARREMEAGLRRAQVMAKLAHIITGPGGEFESWSETLPALIGLDPAQVPRDTRAWLELVHPEDRALFRAKSLQAAHMREGGDMEYRLRRGAGLIHVRQTMEPLAPDERDEAPPRWFNTLQDVSDQVRAQERIRRLNRVHAVLSGINSAIVRIRDRQELFQEACRVAVEAGRFVMAWIGVVDRQGGMVDPVATAGDVRDFFERAPMAVLENKPGGHGLSGRAVRAKAPVVSNDVKNDPQRLMRQELDERGINSLAILPLLVNGEAVGVLALYAADVGFFDEQEMRLLAELAGDISFALDHLDKARQIDYISYYDPLTGLPNRTLFHERLKLQLEDAGRQGQRVALQIIDVERFKTINDTLGRQSGDALLAELARRMAHAVHQASWLARIGADHFAIVTPGVKTEQEVARHTERRASETFAAPFAIAGTELHISVRIGTALFPNDGADSDTLLRNAEAAVKKAKTTGERYLFYTQEMSARIADKLALENKLRRALERDEFVLHYQPKVELEGRRVVGLEALIRWQSPELGLVPPLRFIPLLEETGLILEVGSWALRRAALEHRHWLEGGLRPPKIAVNVSAIQLRQRDFVRIVQESIAGSAGIDLEITESLIMEDIQASIERLAAVRDLGIGIAIDDFGTGYSSLAYLARLPVETLKIDRSFIITMDKDPTTMTLVQTIIQLARSLRLKVVAEGVETEDQANILRLLRCDQMQGYLFSKPLPAGELAGLLGKVGRP